MSDGTTNQPPWHAETISAEMLEVLRTLQKGMVLEGAYLAGGTGLALRLGHRLSVDLDFFLGDAFDEDMLLQRIQLLPNISGVQRAPQTLHLARSGREGKLARISISSALPSRAFRRSTGG
jgi:hypothetical protein